MLRWVVTSACLVVFPAIALAQSRADLDQARDFSAYRTVAIEVTPPVGIDGKPDEGNTIRMNELRRAAEHELIIRGLVMATTGRPDLVARVTSREVERQEISSTGYAPWGWGWGYGYGYHFSTMTYAYPWVGWGPAGWDLRTYRYIEGTVMVDVLDGASGDLIYRAAESDVFDGDLADEVNEAMHDAFKDFPIRELEDEEGSVS
jgi:hypothetical protein